MPASFSELLQNIQAQNKAQRNEMWNQISPYLQVFHKQAVYNNEKKKLASGLGEIAKGEGWQFNSPTAEGGLPSPELMQAQFNSQRTVQLESQATEQWFTTNNQPLPAGWDTMTMQQKKIARDKSTNDFAYNTAIGDLLAAYPEVKSRLPKDFEDRSPTQRKAILDRLVPELKEELSYNLKMSKAGSSGGGSGGGASDSGSGGMAASYAQADDALTKQGAYKKELEVLRTQGKYYRTDDTGKKGARVRVAWNEGGGVNIYFSDGTKVINNQYYKANGKKGTLKDDTKIKVMQTAKDDFLSIVSKYKNSSDEVTRSQIGIPKTGSGNNPFGDIAIPVP